MTVCEFLHCSFSELSSRCPSLVDQPLIVSYIKEKSRIEKQIMDDAKGPPIPKSSSPRRP